MKPIMDVETYIAIDQWFALIGGCVFIIWFGYLLIRYVPVLIWYFFEDLKESRQRKKEWRERIANEPNVFEEFNKKPKSEKERMKDLKGDF